MGVPLSGALLSKQGMSRAAPGAEASVLMSGLRLRSRGAWGRGNRLVGRADLGCPGPSPPTGNLPEIWGCLLWGSLRLAPPRVPPTLSDPPGSTSHWDPQNRGDQGQGALRAGDPQWGQVKRGEVQGAEGVATVAEEWGAHHQNC